MAHHEVTSLALLPLLAASQFLHFTPFLHSPNFTHSHPRIEVALRKENVRPWHEVEYDFLECEYRSVRDRQLRELEMEDDIMSRVAIRCVAFPLPIDTHNPDVD